MALSAWEKVTRSLHACNCNVARLGYKVSFMQGVSGRKFRKSATPYLNYQFLAEGTYDEYIYPN